MIALETLYLPARIRLVWATRCYSTLRKSFSIRVLQYYRSQEFELKVQQLKDNESTFNYKSTIRGDLEKFSFFRIVPPRASASDNPKKYDIRPNMPVKSNRDEISYNEDIVVFQASDDNTMKRISSDDLITFCEVKNLESHPEMLANFIGLVHEISPDLLEGPNEMPGQHPAPALMAAKKSSTNVNVLKNRMESRYTVNFFLNYENNSGALLNGKKICE